MIFLSWFSKPNLTPLLKSKLFDENTFYEAFINDLKRCRQEVIIESPYIACKRMEILELILQKLVKRGVKVYIITRSPQEHEINLARQAELEISILEEMGVQVLLCAGNHHRKLAIIDRKLLWEGSLNILSQGWSREIMRRIESEELTLQMFKFLRLEKVL
ncbi:MAG: phospholipase D-like domain-containing protein [Candidatus Daviesbacteria bacterium]|nr:phospholipase D-like domain-containing protein [Candidatus Daviesbacteria bacterium]